mmetsp:Transcript_86053/g.240592  ORF Transcript_86053/g.240592 Transcript_86053/m.240592 type:complete len:201 (+) Transcript_86053:1311-1913(+)
MSDFSCLSLSKSACVLFLNSGVGSPIATQATRLKLQLGNFRREAVLSSFTRFALRSMTTKSRCITGAAACKIRLTLKSSSDAMPKPVSGLSFEALAPPWPPRWRWMPLSSHQATMTRSLSSVYLGLASRNMSSQSKGPSSGRPTGKSASYFPSFGTSGAGAISAWSLSAEPTMRHLKGNGSVGSGPKFGFKVTFLNAMVG